MPSVEPFGSHLREVNIHILMRRYVESLLLSFPRRKINTDCNPIRLRKYHDKLETHRTSKSRVATPDCSIDLNLMVKGNGSFTMNYRV